MPLPTSVIIPARNAANTIARTIESLLQQTYAGWEAIIIDDGSTDGTAALVQPYAEKDDRIHLVQQANAGVSGARNEGIRLAKYDWLLFLDADDWIATEHIEKLTDHIAASNTVDLVHCGWCRVNTVGEVIQNKEGAALQDPFSLLANCCPFAIHACIVRKSLVEAVGAFDTDLPICEDWDLWLRLARIGAAFSHVKEVYAYYLVRPQSLSGNALLFYEKALQLTKLACYPDPRLQHLSVPQKIQPVKGLPERQLYIASWAAGLLLSSGADARSLLALYSNAPALALEPYWVAENLFDSVLIPPAQPVDQWYRLWPVIEVPLKDFLTALETLSGAPQLARRTQLQLERMILQHSVTNQPESIGTTYAVTIEVADEITDMAIPGQGIERLYGVVKMEGERLGIIELPVGTATLPSWMIKDAIAAQYAWSILGRFFQHTVYRTEGEDSAFYTSKHNEEGWTIFLQQLWGKDMASNDFYDTALHTDEAAATIEADTVVSIEISHPLPQLKTVATKMKVVFTVGGIVAGTVSVVPTNGTISPQTLRAAITTASGFELCRMVVREALIGRSLTDPATLRQRLAEATTHMAASLQLTDSYCLQTYASNDLASGTLLLGHNSGEMGTSASRFTVLPAGAASDLRHMAKITGMPIWEPAATSNVDRVAYMPTFIRFSTHATEAVGVKHHLAEKATAYGRQHFETLFSKNPDPWKYTNGYEQTKYEQTLSLLPQGKIDKALELACAEGHFTVQLAPLVDTLVAADISKIALERAAARCQSFDHITYQQLDLVKDAIYGRYNLIICSEVLYYVGSREQLKKVAQKMAAALQSGGFLIMAHAHQVVDEPNSPGFDWGLPFGAKAISDTFSSLPSLQLVREIRTPLYRIQLFQHHRTFPLFGSKKQKPEIINVPQPAPVPASVANTVRWNGGEPYKETAEPIVTRQLPILMYHRVAPEGAGHMSRYRIAPAAFEEQLQYLRDSGYYSISLQEWLTAMLARHPLPGKAIILTFDDGYADFYDYAWPLLKKYGFSATVFLVSDCIGKTNSWDNAYGEEVPLMGWEHIRPLQKEGVEFGSHSASHPLMTALPLTEIVRQGAAARAVLEHNLGTPVNTIAYPYGDTDAIVTRLLGGCGYTIGVSCREGLSTFLDDPMSLPRIEVKGTDSLQEFIIKISS